MSSTHKKKAERGLDFYATPAWVTEALLEKLDIDASCNIVDPCAGSGAILQAVHRRIGGGTRVWGYEIDPQRAQDSDLSSVSVRGARLVRRGARRVVFVLA